MTEDLELVRVPLEREGARRKLESFLARHGLRYEEDIETAFALRTDGGAIVGCGCAAGGLLKCFAVDEALRGQNALGPLCSALIRDRFSEGCYDLFAVTRKKYVPQFVSSGFHCIADTEELALLENRKDGPDRFVEPFFCMGDENRRVGAAVMNCNPFTLGHRSLIERAAGDCDVLHVFVVEEDRSLFPAEDRFRLVCEGTEDLPNVRVHLSGHYMISQESFPSYFIKDGENAIAMQARLDATLFATRIAPPLHICVRYAGEEPCDSVTEQYNQVMREVFPQYGVEFKVFPRLKIGNKPISASYVRTLLQDDPDSAELGILLPACTISYLSMRRWHGAD